MTLQDLGTIMDGIRLFDEEIVRTGHNWAIGVRSRNGRRRRQTVECWTYEGDPGIIRRLGGITVNECRKPLERITSRAGSRTSRE